MTSQQIRTKTNVMKLSTMSLIMILFLSSSMMGMVVNSFSPSSSSTISIIKPSSSLSITRQQIHYQQQHSLVSTFNLSHSTNLQHPISKSYSKKRQSSASVVIFATPATATAASTGLAATISSLIPKITNALHNDLSFVLSSILLLSVFGVTLERRTTFGKALSAPLATMALALTIANVGIMPFSSPIYTIISKFLVPLAVPLLLFDSDLKRVLSDTGSLLLAFFVGALSTILATLLTFPLFPLKSLGNNEGWKIACALAARHIGGAINFVAVADTLHVGGSAVSAAIAADNVVVALYFTLLFYLAQAGEESESSRSSSINDDDGGKEEIVKKIDIQDPESFDGLDDNENNNDPTTAQQKNAITMPSIGVSVAVSSCLVTLGGILTKLILPPGTSSLPLTSILTVIAATAFPKFFTKIRAAGTAVGIFFIQMFFAASGASGSIRLVMKSAPSLFLFSILQIGIHFAILMGLGRWILKLKANDLYLASNACVGGPTTAAAMAQAKEWPQKVLPALLIGILGYATATAIALGLGPILLRLPIVR